MCKFLALALSAIAPAAAIAQGAFTERVLGADETPAFLRIDVSGYNIRSSPQFSYLRPENIDFHSPKGATYPVIEVVQMENGQAYKIQARGKERWVYVPNWRRQDFQFCQTETCLAPDLADIMDILNGRNISRDQLAACGLTVESNGVVHAYSALSAPAQVPAGTETPVSEAETAPDAEAAQAPLEITVHASPEQRQELSASAYAALARAPVPETRRDRQPEVVLPANVPIPVFRPEQPRARTQAPARQQQQAPRNVSSYPFVAQPLWEAAVPGKGREWSHIVWTALGKHGRALLQTRTLRDQQNWCPNYTRLNANQRAEFWVHLIAGFNRYESGFKTNAVFDERSKNNPTRGRIDPANHSMGLGQLSYNSVNQRAYRNFCNISWAADRGKDISDRNLQIFDPKRNLECQVGILNHWVSRDGGIGYNGGRTLSGRISWRGGARFWSTLRYNNPATKRVQNSLKRFRPCWQ